MSTTDILSPEQIEQIEKNMQKDAFSETGFLASSERLKDIIESDARTLQNLGITHKQIGDRLEGIIGKAERLEQLSQRGQFRIENEPTVENQYRVSWSIYFGMQECPFINPDGKPCRERTSFDYVIEKIGTNSKISFSGLIIHLVRDHNFFEGSVNYRLDPKQAISTLDIQPGHDYTPSYATEKIWRREQGTTQYYDDLERGEKLAYQTAVNSADEVIKLSDKTCIYFWNGICVTVSGTDFLISKELIVADGYWANMKIKKGVWVYKPQNNTYVEI